MKSQIANDKTKYRSRSSLRDPAKQSQMTYQPCKVRQAEEFYVDSKGYFHWPSSSDELKEKK